jgi:hypothetical protein
VLRAAKSHGVVAGSDFAGRMLLLACGNTEQPEPASKTARILTIQPRLGFLIAMSVFLSESLGVQVAMALIIASPIVGDNIIEAVKQSNFPIEGCGLAYYNA